MGDFLPYFILIIFIVVAIIVYIAIKTFEKKRLAKIKHIDPNVKPKLKLNIPYLNSAEVNFLASFQNSIPSEYVAFPKVPMSEIVKPDGSMVIFNEVKDIPVDVCVFMKKNMQPVLVIDLVSSDSALLTMNEYVVKSLKSVNIPVLKIKTKEQYEKIELLEQFLEKLDPISIAQLKKQS